MSEHQKRADPLTGHAPKTRLVGLALALVVGVTLLAAQGSRSLDVAFGLVIEAAGAADQLIRLEDLAGRRRILYLPEATAPRPVMPGDYVVAHVDGQVVLAGGVYPVVRRVWSLPYPSLQSPRDLLRKLGGLPRSHPFEAGIVGIAVVAAPIAVTELGVAAIGGTVASAAVWLVLRSGSVLDGVAGASWTPVVLVLAFLFGAALTGTFRVPHAVVVRVFAGIIGFTLAQGMAQVLGWPPQVVTSVILVSAIPFPRIPVWLVGSYLLAVALEPPTYLAAHGVLAVAGVVTYTAARLERLRTHRAVT